MRGGNTIPEQTWDRGRFHLCYLEESGDEGALAALDSPATPLLCILGLTIPSDRLRDFTRYWLALKRDYFARRFGFAPTHPLLRFIDSEIKGSDLRSAFKLAHNPEGRSADRRRSYYTHFLDSVVRLVEAHESTLTGAVWIKKPGAPKLGLHAYLHAVRHVATTFQHLLESRPGAFGAIIPDPRLHAQDLRVALSVFDQKFGSRDSFSRLVEVPTFGVSSCHAGIQVADILCSALLFPIAAYSFCYAVLKESPHVDEGYRYLKRRYGGRLLKLQHRYVEPPGRRWVGGITVSDALTERHGGYLFKDLSEAERASVSSEQNETCTAVVEHWLYRELEFSVNWESKPRICAVSPAGRGHEEVLAYCPAWASVERIVLPMQVTAAAGVSEVMGAALLPDESVDCVVLQDADRMPSKWFAELAAAVERILKPQGYVVVAMVAEDNAFQGAVATLLEPYLGYTVPEPKPSAAPILVAPLKDRGYEQCLEREVRVTVPIMVSEAVERVMALPLWERVVPWREDTARDVLEDWLRDQASGDAVELSLTVRLVGSRKPLPGPTKTLRRAADRDETASEA